MIHSMQQKTVAITPPAAILNNGAFTCATVDTQGFKWLDVYVFLGALDIGITVLKMTQSDVDSGYADLAGADFSTGTGTGGVAAVVPSATDDNHLFCFRIDLRGKKRFQKLACTMGNGSTGGFMAAFGVLSRAENVPDSMSARGMTGEIKV